MRELQQEWNRRLDSEGLGRLDKIDDRGNAVMKQSASNSYRGADSLERETRLQFFLECSSMVQQFKFKRKIDRFIMELYCEGNTKEEIRQILETHGIDYDRRGIYAIIKRHLIIFGLNAK